MGLKTVLNAVEARVATVIGASGAKQPNFGFGETAKYKNEAPPRVNWVPLQGPTAEGDESTTTTRKLWKRQLQLEVRIWCDDYEDVEILASHVFAAFTRVHGGRYGVLSESWDTSGGNLKKGVLGVFILNVRLAFSDEATKTVDGSGTPLTVDVTTELEPAGFSP